MEAIVIEYFGGVKVVWGLCKLGFSLGLDLFQSQADHRLLYFFFLIKLSIVVVLLFILLLIFSFHHFLMILSY